MIKSTKGDILKADAEALVNTVNCVGVMGRGIALQFKKKFPDNFKHYKKKCDEKELVPGTMFVFDTGNMSANATSSTSPRRITGAAKVKWRTSFPGWKL